MGSDRHYPEERPLHLSQVKPFRIDCTAVTNSQFAEFVAATEYRTTAEVPLDPASAPSMPAEYFEAGLLVFQMTAGPVDQRGFRQWWKFTAGANWRSPEGPTSSVDSRMDHPVVHVSLPDALAYAGWAGMSLPAEHQWEFTANGGSEQEYPWGSDLDQNGVQHANTWQGEFPYKNFKRMAAPFSMPVDSFAANAFGRFNMIGIVWE